ncbi:MULTISPECIES: cytochrome c550 [Bacillaceae]|uniref:Cytochrome c550 n=1 Tax=Peribacillus huizhouensis TaxID=1501239 RepID=A0ABR6CL87_9BACI|nr:MULTISPECIES: cytochrome c [Bacillaceae]MBA9025461.1 cytochrome c550 [Peribacillus huizhouensis]
MKRNPVIPFILIMVLGIGLMFMLSFKGLGDAKNIAKEKEGGGEKTGEQVAASPEELYKTKSCIGCHGGNYEGGVGPKLAGVGEHLSVDEVKDIIKNGKGPMPGGLIPEGSIDAMAEFIHGLK